MWGPLWRKKKHDRPSDWMKFAAAHELLCRKKFINISWPGKKSLDQRQLLEKQTFVCKIWNIRMYGKIWKQWNWSHHHYVRYGNVTSSLFNSIPYLPANALRICAKPTSNKASQARPESLLQTYRRLQTNCFHDIYKFYIFFSPIEVICVSAASGVQTHARRLFKSQPITWELRITFLCSNSFHFSSQRDGWKYVRMKKRCKGKPYKFERAERENEMSFDVVHATRLPWFASLLLLLPANKPFISNRRRREVRRRKLVPFRERWKAF